MQRNTVGIVVPVLIIGVGIAWLVEALDVMPSVDWLWTGGLAVSGLLVLASGRLNKLSFVAGLFLLTSSVLSFLNQTGTLSVAIGLPVLVIAFGVLLLLAHLMRLPLPEFMRDEEPEAK